MGDRRRHRGARRIHPFGADYAVDLEGRQRSEDADDPGQSRRSPVARFLPWPRPGARTHQDRKQILRPPVGGQAASATGQLLSAGALKFMVYGEDSERGLRARRRFLHAKLGFTFLAPRGWFSTIAAPSRARRQGRWRSGAAGGRVAVRPNSSSPNIHVRLIETSIQSIEELTINGFQIGDGDREGRPVVVPALRGAVRRSEVYRFIFAAGEHIQGRRCSSASGWGSFRRMTVAESQAARPLRIKVVTVAPGTRSSGWQRAWRLPTAR